MDLDLMLLREIRPLSRTKAQARQAKRRQLVIVGLFVQDMYIMSK